MRTRGGWWGRLNAWQRTAFRVLLTVAILLLINAAGWVVGSRADARASRLRAEVLEASADLSPSEARAAWAGYIGEVGVPRNRDLAGLVFPGVDTDMKSAFWDGELVHISLASGWWLENRCVIVVLGGEEPTASIADGSAC